MTSLRYVTVGDDSDTLSKSAGPCPPRPAAVLTWKIRSRLVPRGRYWTLANETENETAAQGPASHGREVG